VVGPHYKNSGRI